MCFFGGCSQMRGGGRGRVGKKATLPEICHTHPTMMKLGTVILYQKKIQKIYESRDTPLDFYWYQHLEWSWFKFNNLALALGTNLKFSTSLSKGLKLKVRKFCGLIPTFAEVTGEKRVGAALSPPILNRFNKFPNQTTNRKFMVSFVAKIFISEMLHLRELHHERLWKVSRIFVIKFAEIKLKWKCP